MKLGRRSADRDRPRRRPRVAGLPRPDSGAEGPDDTSSVHDDVAIPLIEKLSQFKVRALALSVLWLIFFVVCQFGLDLLRPDPAEVARTGVWVQGTVEKVEPSSKSGRKKITLAYSDGSKPRTIAVGMRAARGLEVGDKVSLVYEPGNPAKLLALDGEVVGDSDDVLLTPLSFSAFLGFPVCLYAAYLWRSRYRSASKTGLREATATVRPGWLYPRIDVYLEHDYMLLQTRRSLRIAPRFKGLQKVPVFIGGEESDMIVIFPRGRFSKDTLYTVPVKEIEPDTA
ncbi:hypothetical protein [Amycolatopsis keratiniphila]|uniref:hypothetical protein n=1 Tax=Amycolatopsis keratiniphila TaxID=129921 RepID=UPI0011773B2C|nr:hypothetical protein [Amycolatopsis keratiniphila]